MNKSRLLNSFLFFIYILFCLQIIFPVNHLLFLNKFSQHENFVITGIKYSNESGITSYDMFPVGYVYEDKDLNGFSLEKNIYKATDELNRSYYLGEGLPKNVSRVTYAKSSGFVTRLVPFLISKTNIFNIDMYIYISFFYLSISFLSFSIIANKIFNTQNLFSSIIFIFLNILNGYFITSIYSFNSSYFYFALPLVVLSNDNLRKKILIKNNFTLTFLMYLMSLFAERTQGYLPFFIFLMGITMFEKINIHLVKDKKFLIRNFTIFCLAYFTTELATIIQKVYISKATLDNIISSFISSLQKYNLFNSSNTYLDSCASGGYSNFLIEFLNIKVLDFILFEIDLFGLILLLILLTFYSSKQEIKSKFYASIFCLSITFIWFMLIKGAFLCHLHVYPRYLLYSFLPIFSVALGNFSLKNKNVR